MFHCPICSCCETDFGFRFEKCSVHQEFLKLPWNQKISLTKTCCLKYLLSIYLNSANVKPEAHRVTVTVSLHCSLVFARGNSIHYMEIKINNNNNNQSLCDSPLLLLSVCLYMHQKSMAMTDMFHKVYKVGHSPKAQKHLWRLCVLFAISLSKM